MRTPRHAKNRCRLGNRARETLATKPIVGAASSVTANAVRVGLDYRPAVLTNAGIGRSVRELARALAARTDVDLHLFAHSWAPALGLECPGGAELHRWPIPGRSLGALSVLGADATTLSGGAEVFHWTDYIHPPVNRAPAVLTIHDLAFAADETFHGEQSDRAARAHANRRASRARRRHADARDQGSRGRAARDPAGQDSRHPLRDRPRPLRRRPCPAGSPLPAGSRHDRTAEEPRPAAPRLGAVARPPPVAGGDRAGRLAVRQHRRRLAERDARPNRCAGSKSPTIARCITTCGTAAALVYPSLLEGFGFRPSKP